MSGFYFIGETLQREDLQTRAWDRLENDLRARLQRLREENDHGDAETTAKRRGRIAEIVGLLAWADMAKAQPSEHSR